MTINEYIAKNKSFGFMRLLPKVTCTDGLILSVQASWAHYCSPRNDEGPYTSVEVGYPSSAVEDLLPYAEDPSSPTDTVYGFVPVEVVDAVIAAHGGIKS